MPIQVTRVDKFGPYLGKDQLVPVLKKQVHFFIFYDFIYMLEHQQMFVRYWGLMHQYVLVRVI